MVLIRTALLLFLLESECSVLLPPFFFLIEGFLWQYCIPFNQTTVALVMYNPRNIIKTFCGSLACLLITELPLRKSDLKFLD